jgi:hypothetical protein
MKRLRNWLFVLALGMTVIFVPGLDCDGSNDDCEFLCDDDD